jgi:hypothetical protein
MRKMTLLTSLTTITFVGAALATLAAAIVFTATYKSIDAGAVSFAGKKVAALVISKDDSLRMAGEESLARELSARGMQAVATYRMAPKEELQSAETARPWFERANVEGIVALRPVTVESRQAYTAGTWVNPNYSTLWGYYGYGWGSVYVIGTVPKQTRVTIETTIYSVSRNQLLWAAVTEATSSGDLREFVDELAKEMVKEMQEQGLARGQSR